VTFCNILTKSSGSACSKRSGVMCEGVCYHQIHRLRLSIRKVRAEAIRRSTARLQHGMIMEQYKQLQ
jgi:hypothetical protein